MRARTQLFVLTLGSALALAAVAGCRNGPQTDTFDTNGVGPGRASGQAPDTTHAVAPSAASSSTRDTTRRDSTRPGRTG
jgi:hypothetical protein